MKQHAVSWNLFLFAFWFCTAVLRELLLMATALIDSLLGWGSSDRGGGGGGRGEREEGALRISTGN